MTTREEIREGIAIRLGITGAPSKEHWDRYFDERQKAIYFGWADQNLAFLDSKGVAIKVDKPLPVAVSYGVDTPLGSENPIAFETVQITPEIRRMIQALKLTATEPLIKED